MRHTAICLITFFSTCDVIDDPLFDTESRYQAVKKEEENTSTSTTDGEDVEMKPAALDKKAELLASHPDSVRRMGIILIPTLIEVYSSTVHLKVRQRAINALVKLIYFTGDSVLESVLKVCGRHDVVLVDQLTYRLKYAHICSHKQLQFLF
jgi:hypothetical protein